MLRTAFKEWAAVCRALADGRQSLILRKGGIAEADGEFRPEHARFWLYPTHFHEQQQKGLKSEAIPLLEAAERYLPEAGLLRLSHLVGVAEVVRLSQLEEALALDPFHVWTADTVMQRFHYRTPGLYALLVRVYEAPAPVDIAEHPSYAGCKTWVELDREVDDAGAKPVLSVAKFDTAVDQIRAAILTASNNSSS
jgi:hypothetical protein